jgi:MFS family permease
VLAAGPDSVGLLNGVLGVGGVVGALVALAASTRLPLGRQLCLGTLVWGTPLLIIALEPTFVAALPLCLCVGIGNVCVDVSAYTLIQRSAPSGELGRIFGALEGFSVASGGLGVGLGGILTDLLGTRPVLAAMGLALIGLALGGRHALDRLDRPAPSDSMTCHRRDGPCVSWAGDAEPAPS